MKRDKDDRILTEMGMPNDYLWLSLYPKGVVQRSTIWVWMFESKLQVRSVQGGWKLRQARQTRIDDRSSSTEVQWLSRSSRRYQPVEGHMFDPAENGQCWYDALPNQQVSKGS